MTNDFLVKVKEAEQRAAEMIEKALKKKQSDLLKYKQDLAQKYEEVTRKLKIEMNNDLQKSKVEARRNYESELLAGEKAAKTMKTEKLNMLDGVVADAEKLFLSII